MKVKNKLTWDRLTDALDIDPSTGVCRWKNPGPHCHNMKPGDVAGCQKSDGYWRISIDGTRYYRHHLVWFFVKKVLPDRFIDHKDGATNHDWISNLRPADPSKNQQNNHRRKGITGVKGVSFKDGKYVARVTLNQHTHHLGYFPTLEEAAAAYAKGAIALFGEYACVS